MCAHRVWMKLARVSLGKRRRHVMDRDHAEYVFFIEVQHAELGVTESRRVGEQSLKHWRQLARRRTDDLQDLRCCRLLLQRFAQLAENDNRAAGWVRRSSLKFCLERGP